MTGEFYRADHHLEFVMEQRCGDTNLSKEERDEARKIFDMVTTMHVINKNHFNFVEDQLILTIPQVIDCKI